MKDIIKKCRAQFQFYADEHRKAGKFEKVATNQSFADMYANAADAYVYANAYAGSIKRLASGMVEYLARVPASDEVTK